MIDLTGNQFREIRKALGLSQAQLAQFFKINKKTIVRIEGRADQNIERHYALSMRWIRVNADLLGDIQR